MRFRQYEDESEVRVELTSMTDVVFLLLIFFMISTTFVDLGRHLDIQLPETKAGEAAPGVQQHVIEMRVQGVLYLDGQPTQVQDIPQRLTQQGEAIRQRSVIIRADKRLPYGEVMAVLDLVRQSRIHDIAVAVR